MEDVKSTYFQDGVTLANDDNTNITYGTVAVNLTFLVNGSFATRYPSGIIYSSFNGTDVGTQIRGQDVDLNHCVVWSVVCSMMLTLVPVCCHNNIGLPAS